MKISRNRSSGMCSADGSTAFGRDGEAISSHFFGQSAFAEHTNAPAHGVVKVPDDAPLEILGPLGCGIMTGAGAVLNVLQPRPGSAVAVFGTGAVGMSGMLAAKAAGATTIIMVDIVPERLAFAEELGATHTVDSKETDPVEAIKEITGGGVNYALDTTGVPAVFTQMTASLATMGHGVLVGAAKLGTEAPIDIGTLLLAGIRINLVIEGDAVPKESIPRLIRLHAEGLFPFDRLVKKYSFDDVNQAFAEYAGRPREELRAATAAAHHVGAEGLDGRWRTFRPYDTEIQIGTPLLVCSATQQVGTWPPGAVDLCGPPGERHGAKSPSGR